MKKALRDKALFSWAKILPGLMAAALAAGCASVNLPTQIQDLGPGYRPSNIYRRTNSLPAEVKRVALLPLTTTSDTPFLAAGAETLEPILYAELEKTKRFEIIPVTRDQMKQWTSHTGWRTDEQMPRDIFEKLRAGTGCDAILFCQLTRYQPYQPVAVGWKFSLIQAMNKPSAGEANAPLILWSADEVLDSGDPAVATSARAYYTQHLRNEAPSADVSTMMSSPTRFGQYTIATLLATLPERAGQNPK